MHAGERYQVRNLLDSLSFCHLSKGTMGKKDAAAVKSGSASHGDAEAVSKVIDKLKAKKQEEEEEDDEEEEEDGDEEGDDFIADLPKKVVKRVVAIRKLHTEVEKLDAEYKKERIALEQKYLALKQPIFESRNQIISGEVEAPVDETAEAEPEEASESEEPVAGIPGFWLQCLGAHHITGDLICEDDVPALEALTGIKCDYDADFTAFTLTFSFAENEYFTNKTLTKRYGVSPDLLDEKAPALTSNEGCEIDWKPSKNLTVTELKKKQKAKSGKNKGQVRTIVKTVPKASFFHYFSQPTGDEEEDQEDEEKNEDEPEEGRIKLTMEEDYDVGHTIRTAIIPEAVLWYTGEQVDEEYDDDYDMGDEEDDEDEEVGAIYIFFSLR